MRPILNRMTALGVLEVSEIVYRTDELPPRMWVWVLGLRIHRLSMLKMIAWAEKPFTPATARKSDKSIDFIKLLKPKSNTNVGSH